MAELLNNTQTPVQTAQNQSSTTSQSRFLDVGNVLVLRNEIDPNHIITNHVRSKLHIVDLIPAYYAIDFSRLGNQDNSNYLITYDYNAAIQRYTESCNKYGLPGYSGLRLWLTDDTTAAENFGQEYADNVISQYINNMADISKLWRSLGRSAGGSAYGSGTGQTATVAGSGIRKAISSIAEGMKEGGITDTTLINSIGNQLGNLAGTAIEMVLQGKKMSLPKIWVGSSYDSSLNFNVKLVSPYGDPRAIENYITKPLVYLLLLGIPKSNDGLTYGLATPLRIKAYGLSDINLGAITSITLQRGNMNISYNQYRQPMVVDVRLTIAPLVTGFAAMTGDIEDVAKFETAQQYRQESDFEPSLPALNTIGNVIKSMRPASKTIAKYAELPLSDKIRQSLGEDTAAEYPTAVPNELASVGSKAVDYVTNAISNVSNDGVDSNVSTQSSRLNPFGR